MLDRGLPDAVPHLELSRFWAAIAARLVGEKIELPSCLARHREREAALLLADVIAASSNIPRQSTNEIAAAHGVSSRRVQQIRQQLRADRDAEARKQVRTRPGHPR